MKANDVSHGYNLQRFNDLVDRDLKNLLKNGEEYYLECNVGEWKRTLITLKKKTEKQFTSSKARSFTMFKDMHAGEISVAEYFAKLEKEKIWRVNTATFLQKIEARLQQIKQLPDE